MEVIWGENKQQIKLMEARQGLKSQIRRLVRWGSSLEMLNQQWWISNSDNTAKKTDENP